MRTSDGYGATIGSEWGTTKTFNARRRSLRVGWSPIRYAESIRTGGLGLALGASYLAYLPQYLACVRRCSLLTAAYLPDMCGIPGHAIV